MLQVNGATLKQEKKFKYFGVTFMSDGRQDEELNTQISKASAVMQDLPFSAVMKQELSKKGKTIIFQNSFCPFSSHLWS